MDITKRIKRIRRRARSKSMDCDLNVAWLRKKMRNNECEATGMEFDFKDPNSPFYPSIDRIDSEKGYTQDNCQIVTRIFNSCKHRWKIEVFETWAKEFVKYYEADMGKYL